MMSVYEEDPTATVPSTQAVSLQVASMGMCDPTEVPFDCGAFFWERVGEFPLVYSWDRSDLTSSVVACCAYRDIMAFTRKTTFHFKPYCPDQMLLLPPDLKQWLPEGDLAYFIMDVVGELDLSPIRHSYSSSRAGQPPSNPQMMTSLILHAYCVGLPSSRKIEAATYTQVPFHVITTDQHPDHDTIAGFRKTHLKALGGLFVQVLQWCPKDRAGQAGAHRSGRHKGQGQSRCQTQADCRTGVWTDQRASRLSTILVAGVGQCELRMGHRLPNAQPLEAVPQRLPGPKGLNQLSGPLCSS